jgi:hypothetical protein
MTDSGKQDNKSKRSAFETFTEIMGWLQIFASPFLIGLFIGAIIYIARPGRITFLVGLALLIVGVTLGIVWATRAWKKKGTIDFISRVMSTSESDNAEDTGK